MQPERLCSQCGRPIPWGLDKCPNCFPAGSMFWLSREALMLLTLAVLTALFIATGFAAKFYHAKEKALAKDWAGRGEAALKAKRPHKATNDFRTSLVYAPNDREVQLLLAEALASTGHLDGAFTYLQGLWDQSPGDGVTNLRLARLYALIGNIEEATRFYHGAIYGIWRRNPQDHQSAVRLELSKFLIAHGLKPQADSELIALAASLPKNSPDRLTVGAMFLDIGDNAAALDQFRDAVQSNSRNASAWQGAGMSAFRLGDYRQAADDLERAMRGGIKDATTVREFEVSRLVIEDNPFEPRLSEFERAKRGAQAFRLALTRLEGCGAQNDIQLAPEAAGSDPLQIAYAQAMASRAQNRVPNLLHHPEVLVNLLRQVGQMETVAQTECGPGGAQDRALLLIAQQRTMVSQ